MISPFPCVRIPRLPGLTVVATTVVRRTVCPQRDIVEVSKYTETRIANGLSIPATVMQDTASSSAVPAASLRHAYSVHGASPLCNTAKWKELVPDTEVTCPACCDLQTSGSSRSMVSWGRSLMG